jgi:hypothetical protein
MDGRQLRRGAERVLVLGVVALFALTEVSALLPAPAVRVAEASVVADKKDDKKEKKDTRKHDDDRGEDFVMNGQVLEINTKKDPPEMVLGTVDGRAVVRVLKTDEIVRNGVGVGDYVEVTGEKINELLFEATAISVGERASASSSDNDNSDEEDEDEDDE